MKLLLQFALIWSKSQCSLCVCAVDKIMSWVLATGLVSILSAADGAHVQREKRNEKPSRRQAGKTLCLAAADCADTPWHDKKENSVGAQTKSRHKYFINNNKKTKIKNALQKLGKKNVNHALLAKSVESREPRHTSKMTKTRQAGRRQKMTTISMKIRECHKSLESRECRGEQRNRVGQQKAPTDVVQQGRGAGGDMESGRREGFAVQRCARYGRKR